VVSGQWSVVSGQWSSGLVVSGLVVSGRWSSGQWSVVGGRWSVVGGRWSVVGVSGYRSQESQRRELLPVNEPLQQTLASRRTTRGTGSDCAIGHQSQPKRQAFNRRVYRKYDAPSTELVYCAAKQINRQGPSAGPCLQPPSEGGRPRCQTNRIRCGIVNVLSKKLWEFIGHWIKGRQ
jgi:hypothetical protein